MNKLVELRIRQAGRPAFRLELGRATSRAQLLEMGAQKDLIRRLHDRGEFDVLDALKDGRVTAAELARLVDQHGIADYRRHLALAPVAEMVVPTLDDHVARFLESVKKEGTRGVYRKALTHLRDFKVDGVRLGDGPWHRVARHVILDAKDSLARRLAANTIRTVMGGWSAFFEWALQREQSESGSAGRAPILEANPVRTARGWDPIEITRHRFLSWAELQKLLEVAPAPLRAQYATLALAGLRIEELMMMPRLHVNLPTHIHVGPVGNWVPKGYPRSRRGVRDIPIHRELLPLLKEHARLYAGDDRFFLNPESGNPWTHSTFAVQMRKDVTAAGMEFGQWTRDEGEFSRKPNGVTAHTMRHTLASWLAQSDVQLMKIAQILGDTVEVVSQHYAHLLPKDLDQAINRVGSDL